jgi:Pyruvate/2-oxoacid:ferredoxin oxidoreductase delta subunit
VERNLPRAYTLDKFRFGAPMTHSNNRPIPLIDVQKCDGCGLCVHACPTKAIDLRNGKAFIANSLECEYSGLCEAVCPTQAISRLFEIIIK